MKLTTQKLKQLIKEELSNIKESEVYEFPDVSGSALNPDNIAKYRDSIKHRKPLSEEHIADFQQFKQMLKTLIKDKYGRNQNEIHHYTQIQKFIAGVEMQLDYLFYDLKKIMENPLDYEHLDDEG